MYVFESQSWRKKGRNRARDLPCCWLIIQKAATTGTCSGQSQEPGTPVRSPTWVQKSMDLVHLPQISQERLSGNGIASGASRTGTHTQMRHLCYRPQLNLPCQSQLPFSQF